MKQLKFILYALIIAVQLIGCSPKKEEIKIEKWQLLSADESDGHD